MSAILSTITRFAGSAFNAWLMKPIYQAIIVILVIVVIYQAMKNKKG